MYMISIQIFQDFFDFFDLDAEDFFDLDAENFVGGRTLRSRLKCGLACEICRIPSITVCACAFFC